MTLTAQALADHLQARLEGDPSVEIDRCTAIDQADGRSVTFLANPRYARHLAATRAAAVIAAPQDAAQAPAACARIITDNPYLAFRKAMVLLHGWRAQPGPGVSGQAVVDPSARIDPSASVQPLTYIAAGASIGRECVIHPHCHIGRDAVIGDECVLYPGVVIYDGCVLGRRVTLHAGCVIGQDGFGYATYDGAHHKLPGAGNVVIEDDVEMGANCSVDRATVGGTVIGAGTKFSNGVTIGHGCRVGKHNLFVAQVGLAGSVTTGEYVAIGGQAGVAGHIQIGPGARIAAQSGVASDVPAGETWGGQPAAPMAMARRAVLSTAKLPDLIKQVRQLEKRLRQLESEAGKVG